MNALVYQNDPRHSIKVLMTARLVHQNAKSVPWAGEEDIALVGEQGSTSRDIGPRICNLFKLVIEVTYWDPRNWLVTYLGAVHQKGELSL